MTSISQPAASSSGPGSRSGLRETWKHPRFNGTVSEGRNDSTGGGLPRGIHSRQQNGMRMNQFRLGSNINRRQSTTRQQRAIRSQARAGRFRSNGGSYIQGVRSRIRSFRRGRKRHDCKLRLSTSRLDTSSFSQFSIPHSGTSPDIDSAVTACSEQLVVDQLARQLELGGSGFVEDRKPPDVVRLVGSNVNSLCLFDEARAWKVKKLKAINQRYQADGMMVQECGTDFRQVSEAQSFGVLFGDMDCRSVAANNVTEDSGRSQYGGVASLAFPRLAGFVRETGKDPTGLARWVYLYVGHGKRRTRIVTAYRPVRPSRRLCWDAARG